MQQGQNDASTRPPVTLSFDLLTPKLTVSCPWIIMCRVTH